MHDLSHVKFHSHLVSKYAYMIWAMLNFTAIWSQNMHAWFEPCQISSPILFQNMLGLSRLFRFLILACVRPVRSASPSNIDIQLSPSKASMFLILESFLSTTHSGSLDSSYKLSEHSYVSNIEMLLGLSGPFRFLILKCAWPTQTIHVSNIRICSAYPNYSGF